MTLLLGGSGTALGVGGRYRIDPLDNFNMLGPSSNILAAGFHVGKDIARSVVGDSEITGTTARNFQRVMQGTLTPYTGLFYFRTASDAAREGLVEKLGIPKDRRSLKKRKRSFR